MNPVMHIGQICGIPGDTGNFAITTIWFMYWKPVSIYNLYLGQHTSCAQIKNQLRTHFSRYLIKIKESPAIGGDRRAKVLKLSKRLVRLTFQLYRIPVIRTGTQQFPTNPDPM